MSVAHNSHGCKLFIYSRTNRTILCVRKRTMVLLFTLSCRCRCCRPILMWWPKATRVLLSIRFICKFFNTFLMACAHTQNEAPILKHQNCWQRTIWFWDLSAKNFMICIAMIIMIMEKNKNLLTQHCMLCGCLGYHIKCVSFEDLRIHNAHKIVDIWNYYQFNAWHLIMCKRVKMIVCVRPYQKRQSQIIL